MGFDIKKLVFRDSQKRLYATTKRDSVTDIIRKYKSLGRHNILKVNRVIRNIFEKNIKAMLSGSPPPVHTNFFNLICSPELLLQSYKKIRSNKGATTIAAGLPLGVYNNLLPLQRSFLDDTFNFPNGITLQTFHNAAYLLKIGKYPWGASRRIYIPKLGKPEQTRPITIPPFMDRVVQQAIRTIVEAIYQLRWIKAIVALALGLLKEHARLLPL